MYLYLATYHYLSSIVGNQETDTKLYAANRKESNASSVLVNIDIRYDIRIFMITEVRSLELELKCMQTRACT